MKDKFCSSSVLFAILAILFFGSCSKKIDDAYLNPNAPIDPAIESVLPGVIGSFTTFNSNAGTNFGVILDGNFVGKYVQYFSLTSSNETWAQMAMIGGAADNGGSVWAAVYFGQGTNVSYIIQKATEQQKWDFVGVGWAIRAWGYLELTDEYSDAPLRDANNKDLNVFRYDPQPDFYDSVRAMCMRSLEFLSRTDGNVSQSHLAQGDAYFLGGDVNKWKKFVYGILARSYINLSNKNLFKTNNYADLAIKYAKLGPATNDDNPTVKVSGGPISALNNYWGPFRGNQGSFRQASYIADLMSGALDTAFKGVQDPRRWYRLSENLNGTFKGFLPWLGSTGVTASDYPKNFWRHPTPTSTIPPTSDSSRYLYQDKSPWPMMTAAEMQFIIAEAALRNNDRTQALQAYQNGISLDFDMLTQQYPQNIPAGREITPTSKATYLAAVTPTAAQLSLTHIMLQKYIALYIWGTLETWVDLRKFHYTDVDPATGIKVYTGFFPPTGSNLYPTNNGKWTYRMRPRFNSEYLYAVPELTRIGAYQYPDYNTFEMWFSMKN